MKGHFNLYSSEGCHLCELALAICQLLIPDEQLQVIDIVEDDKLVELYGVHIPVLECVIENEENIQLFWPFTAEQVSQLIN